MRKRLLSNIMVLMLVVGICIPAISTKAADIETISACFHFEQEDARKMFEMVNSYRASAGSDEDENNYPLLYDYELEKVAMQRAAEIAVKFSDTRPDGTNYITTLGEYGFDISPRGEFYAEGILFGTEDSMQLNEAFNLFCETPVDRLNMLGYYTAVGIGHIRTEDKMDFWVQIFATCSMNDIYTAPVSSDMYINMKVPISIAGNVSVAYSSGSQTVGVGETVVAPYYTPSVKFSGSELAKPVALAPLVFESNDGFVKASDGKMTGLKVGSGTLTAQLLGKTYNYSVTVSSGASTLVPTPSPIPVLEPTSADILNANKPTDGPTEIPTQTPDSGKPKKGDTFNELGLNYKVLGSKTVEFTGLSSAKTKSITIPDTVKHAGVTYKITKVGNKAFYKNTTITTVYLGKNVKTIGKQAFYGCSNLSVLCFKGKSLTKVSSKAFSKINTKANIQVLKASETKYKKLFKKGGLSTKVKVVTY